MRELQLAVLNEKTIDVALKEAKRQTERLLEY
jgi:hypothetical protein